MKVGVLAITSFRPFPLAAVRSALQGAQRVVVLEKALTLDPGQLQARILLIIAKEQDGKLDEAIADWKALIEKAPVDAAWRKSAEQRLAEDEAKLAGKPVADFNDAGLMLQAAELDIGVALARELLVADALQRPRLEAAEFDKARSEIAELWAERDRANHNYKVYCIERAAAEDLRAERDRLMEALGKLARLGNGDRYGSSKGNIIAQAALRGESDD